MKNRFTPNDIRLIISNPIYTGIGEFGRAIPDSVWVEAAKIAVNEDGLEEFLRNVAWNLERSFGVELEDKEGWIQDIKSVMEKYGVEKVLQNLLIFFRDFSGKPKGNINNIRKFYIKWRINSPIGKLIIQIINNFPTILNISFLKSSNSGLLNPPNLLSARLVNPPIFNFNLISFGENNYES